MRVSKRGVALAEYVASITIFTIFVAGYFTLAQQKSRSLHFAACKRAALSELTTQLERVRAGVFEEQSALSLEPREHEPTGDWRVVWSGPLQLPADVVAANAVRIYKRPHDEGLDELAVMVFWPSHDGRWLHVRADTLRRAR